MPPRRSLITADAGFAGYEVWKAMLDCGNDLLIRVGGNTTLLRKLDIAKENCKTVSPTFRPERGQDLFELLSRARVDE